MIPILLRHRRRRQPYKVIRVAQSNPLTQGISFLFGSDESFVDSVQDTLGVPSTSASTKPSIVPAYNDSGNATHFVNNSWLSYGTHKGTENLATSSTGVTWAFKWRFSALTHTDSPLARRNDGNAAAGAGWMIGFISNHWEPSVILERVTANTNVVSQTAYPIDLNWHTLVVTSPGDRVGANIKFYQDTTLASTTVNNAGSGASGSDAAQSLEIGRNTFTISGSFQGDIQVLAIERRVWNQAEVEAFHVNEWQLWDNDTTPFYIAPPTPKQSTQWIST